MRTATLILLTSLGTTLGAWGCNKKPAPATSTTLPSEEPAAEDEAAQPAKKGLSPLDIIMELPTFAQAVSATLPMMKDTYNEPSMGAVLLAAWAARNLSWDDVSVKKNETSFALVQKDSDEARGKRMCQSGYLVQISKTDMPTGKVYNGLLTTYGGDLLDYYAAGSTGSLVARSRARFCGVVTGKFDYSNSGGGTGHAVEIVGMFDLPENHPATVIK